MRLRRLASRPLLFVLGMTVAAILAAGSQSQCSAEAKARETPAAKTAAVKTVTTTSGREIFVREWLPNDPRSHGGDGLGPVFNDSSCVACHNQGGIGGGGPASKNVDIVSAALTNPQQAVRGRMQLPTLPKTLVGDLVGVVFGRRIQAKQTQPKPLTPEQLKKRRQQLVKEVIRIHPGFGSARSVVVHKFGVDEGYEKWRLGMTGMNRFGSGGGGFTPSHSQMGGFGPVDVFSDLAVEHAAVPLAAEIGGGNRKSRLTRQDMTRANRRIGAAQTAALGFNEAFFPSAFNRGNFTTSSSQRNPTALFGVGLIDSIPVDVLEEAAKQRFKEFPRVSGRLAMLPDKKIGRFGWKAQKASLHDFTMTACAVELGLNVPEHPQSGLPSKPDYKPAGFDLNQQECDTLVKYLSKLPAPVARPPAVKLEADYLHDGAKLFATVGCATCHAEKLGEVNGIYSDLLLHDMGPGLGDTGSYGVFIPDSPGGDAESPVPPLAQLQKIKPAPTPVDGGDVPQAAVKAVAKQPILGADRLEWRTPPLWGVRDSAPYLHDGRAKNLEQAIAFHGGEGTRSAQRYFLLTSVERLKVQAFLKSLVAPTQVAGK